MRLITIFILCVVLGSCGAPDPGPRAATQRPDRTTEQPSSQKPCLNLNTATEEELISLPDIGEAMAKKIIEYREQHGPFRRPQEIIIVDGFSEKKYRNIADRICVGQ